MTHEQRQSNSRELNKLELDIRYACTPDEPRVLHGYLNRLETEAASSSPSKKRAIYQRAYELLIETISDSLLPWHWRVLCLDQMYRPLCALEKLANSPQRRREQAKRQASFTAISHFFLQTYYPLS